MKWILWFILVCMALFALGMVLELFTRLWNQVIRKKTTIGIELENGPGTKNYVDTANAVLDRDKPVGMDTWLTRDEYLMISQAVKKRVNKA